MRRVSEGNSDLTGRPHKRGACQAEKLVAFSWPLLLVFDGMYRRAGEGHLVFVPVPAQSTRELQRLVQRIAERIGRSLERSGLIRRDIEIAYVAFGPAEEPPIHRLLGASIMYRIATGPREGR